MVDLHTPSRALFLASNTLNDIAFNAARASKADQDTNLVAILFSAAWFAGAIAEIPRGRMVPVALAAQLSGVGMWAYRAAFSGLEAVDAWFPERSWKLAQAHRAPKHLEAAV